MGENTFTRWKWPFWRVGCLGEAPAIHSPARLRAEPASRAASSPDKSCESYSRGFVFHLEYRSFVLGAVVSEDFLGDTQVSEGHQVKSGNGPFLEMASVPCSCFCDKFFVFLIS